MVKPPKKGIFESRYIREKKAYDDYMAQKAVHEAEMGKISEIISRLKSKGQDYSNIANQSQQVLSQNNQAVADAIKSRSNINLQQEEDAQGALDRKKKNQSRVGTGISKADML